MSSTGEVAAFGVDVEDAYWASLLSVNGFKVPQLHSGVLLGGDLLPQLATVAKGLSALGFKLYCTSAVVETFLNGIPYIGSVEKILFPVKDKRKLREVFEQVSANFCPRLSDFTYLEQFLQQYDIQSVINLAQYRGKSLLDEDYVARRFVKSDENIFPLY